jgi:hypothetical protein
MSDHGHGREHDHDYAIVARPYLRVRVVADTGNGGLSACSIALDYDENGVGELSESTGVDRAGFEWRGVEFDVYRNGERLLGDGTDLDVSTVLGYVDDLAMALRRFSRRSR